MYSNLLKYFVVYCTILQLKILLPKNKLLTKKSIVNGPLKVFRMYCIGNNGHALSCFMIHTEVHYNLL